MAKLIFDAELKKLVEGHVPAFGNLDDIKIVDLINNGGGSFQKDNLKRVKTMLSERLSSPVKN